ncbi:MAG: trypsin-like peptidase domain-containing protein [Chloroflexi bacterium]|nr:trypsin-like peptidase domain-containing protein [Chloroflexota bacterium]
MDDQSEGLGSSTGSPGSPARGSRAAHDNRTKPADRAAIDEALAQLRDGTPAEKIAARERLGGVFERRGLLDHAAECYEANILAGVRDPLLYERLAGIYERRGDAALAREARDEARTLIERTLLRAATRRQGERNSAPLSLPGAPSTSLLPAPSDPTMTVGRSAVSGQPVESGASAGSSPDLAAPTVVHPPTPTESPVRSRLDATRPIWAPPPPLGPAAPGTTGATVTRRRAAAPGHDDPVRDLLLELPPRLLAGGATVCALIGLIMIVAALVGRPQQPRVAEHAAPPAEWTARPVVPPSGEPPSAASAVPPSSVAVPAGQAPAEEATTQPAATPATALPTPALPTPVTPTTAPSTPAPPATQASGSDPERAVATLRSLVAFVLTDSGSGSGIAVGDGRFITNNHVVDGVATVTIRLTDGRTAPARVLRVDPARDLALLETTLAGVAAARFRDSRDLHPAENLYVVGYPLGTQIGIEDVTVTRGIFSARRQSRRNVWHVQTDAPMSPGNSGGPVGDSEGRVVGVATFGMRDGESLNFAVAGDEVLAFLDGGGVAPAPPRAQPPAQPVPSQRAPSQPAPAIAARPELVRASFGPDTVAPGGTVDLVYEIANAGTVPVPVVLGTSIRLGSGPWIDDPASDVRIRVTPGRAIYRRQFRVPPGATAGAYDVWATVLSDDLKTDYGQRAATAGLVVATLPPGAPPATATRVPPSAPPRSAATTAPVPRSPAPRTQAEPPTRSPLSQSSGGQQPNATLTTSATRSVAAAAPATRSSSFDPSRYVGRGDTFNCDDFASQADAQAVLRADPSDPNRLDRDGNGVACESNPGPIDRDPVRR